ncbi:MAG: NapH/MauN family ferredoxin-type protein, partial [Gammaproteobacteria bacterium]|nr:NapH/MauN family ferredoxin-type protein [Gammaproteobacteria bacterium]
MNYFVESLAQMFGRAPTKTPRDELKVEVAQIYEEKRKHKLTKADLEALEAAHERTRHRHKWRNRRWITLIVVNLLFVVSYYFDVQLVEGALTASRVVGFHMADLNSALQVMLAYKHVVLNLLIGTVTVFLLWVLLGGRTFCSWVCPYHLLAEFAEKLHLKLVDKKIVTDRTFHRGVRTVFYVIFALLAVVTGYTVFETISPTSILSRALIYGPGLALAWVFFLLLFEVFVSRRAWCRYVCPIGLTYGLVGSISPVRVKYNVTNCHHEGDCRKVCLVPHVLDTTIRMRARDVEVPIGADCTRCGLCVDICPTDSLNFEFVGSKKL